MTLTQSVLLGILQGITESLPVSSSGHLVIAERLMGIRPPGVTLEVVLHVGTAFAALLFFRRTWWRIARELIRLRSCNLAGILVVATLPAAAAGVVFRGLLDQIFHSEMITGIGLLITGSLLCLTVRVRKGDREVNWFRGVMIGIAQALALLPGISRSGMTVGTGLVAGVSRRRAVEFAFLLAVPAIFGAALMEAPRVGKFCVEGHTAPVIAGGIAAFLSGYIAIGVLLRAVQRGRLHWFGYYCIALGGGVVVWSWIVIPG